MESVAKIKIIYFQFIRLAVMSSHAITTKIGLLSNRDYEMLGATKSLRKLMAIKP